MDSKVVHRLRKAANQCQLDIAGGIVRRSSSRFCLGVEHGDYNGTDLFGVGTDRFIWMAFKPNGTDRYRLFSCNFPDDGVVEFSADAIPRIETTARSWARFPFGVASILRRDGYSLGQGMDAVIYGNIPGGGMSRSASLTLNLIISMLQVNEVSDTDGMTNVNLAQAVENDYIGSPCGKLDQIMIMFARSGMGTYYSPKSNSVEHIPLGPGAGDFRLVSLDTGTVRPGLETSTYAIRRRECEELLALIKDDFELRCLADVKDQSLFDQILAKHGATHPDHCRRLKYIFRAQRRFYSMMDAWRSGDIAALGHVFRLDGFGLRDEYQISGKELEAMCDIARTVPGVLGERMLGGGDKGASGAIVRPSAVDALRSAIDIEYPKRCPEYANMHAIHECQIVDGLRTERLGE